MKKLWLYMLIVSLIFSLAACDMFGNDPDDTNSTTTEDTTEETNNDETNTNEADSDDSQDSNEPVNENIVTFSGNIATNDLSNNIDSEQRTRGNEKTLTDLQIVLIYNPHLNWMIHGLEFEQIDINDDGSFSFDIDKGKSFVAFLVDPTREYDKSLGVIGISTSNTEYWEHIDTQLIDGNIALGEITTSSLDRILQSENNVDTLGSTITDKEMVNYIASIDNSLRTIENYINSGFSLVTFPNYQIRNPERTKSTITQWDESYLDSYNFYGYQFYLFSYDKDFGDTPGLRTPYKVENLGGTIFQTGELIDTTFVIRDFTDGYMLQDIHADWEVFYSIPDGGGSILTSLPTDGIWELEDSSGNKKGEFNYSLAYPVSENDNTHLITIVPLLKVNIADGSTDLIESIEVRWYLYDDNTQTYEQVNTAYLQDSFDAWTLSISDFRENADANEMKLIDDFSQDKIGVDKEWHLYDEEKNYFATSISITVFSNGYSVMYANRN